MMSILHCFAINKKDQNKTKDNNHPCNTKKSNKENFKKKSSIANEKIAGLQVMRIRARVNQPAVVHCIAWLLGPNLHLINLFSSIF
jgi:hypothetical protein